MKFLVETLHFIEISATIVVPVCLHIATALLVHIKDQQYIADEAGRMGDTLNSYITFYCRIGPSAHLLPQPKTTEDQASPGNISMLSKDPKTDCPVLLLAKL